MPLDSALPLDGALPPAPALAAAPVARFRAIKRDHHVRTHLCFGGWGRSTGFAAMTSDASKRKSFIAALSRFCIANGLDGVDYDWEFPRNREEHAAYGLLLIDTAEAFRPHGLEVSVALGSRQKLDPIAYAAVDRIHLMTYDMGARHSTYDKAVSAVARLVKSGAPRRKICLGIPFYGRKIDHTDTSMAYAEILRNYAPAPDEDEAGGFYFNNVETIRRKVCYALAEELKGVMIWEISMDTRGETSLMRAIEAEVGRPAASSKAIVRAGKKAAQN